MEANLGLPVFVAFLGGGVLLMVLALAWQRKALSGQSRGLAQVEEALMLSQRAVELQEESNDLLRRAVEQQQEMLRLLGRLTGQPPPAEDSAGGAGTRTGARP